MHTTYRTSAVFGGACLALGMTCSQAVGQSPHHPCGERDKMAEILTGKYGENQVAVGVTMTGGALLEVFSKPDGKTWTILISGGNGLGCIVATGEHLQWKQMPGDVL